MKKIIFFILFFYIGCSPEFRIILSNTDNKQPQTDFEKSKYSIELNYSKLENWCFHADKHNALKIIPKNYHDTTFQSSPNIDVFYIHPTTYYNGITWNATPNYFKDNKAINLTIKNQCSVFSGIANIYAPHYREMHIKGYYDLPNGLQAIEQAYNDVLSAFKYYLNNENEGRAFIIASHSQGTNHAERLIKEYISQDKALLNKMLLAYLIGMPIKKSTFNSISPCLNSHDLNCILSWRTFTENYFTSFEYGEDIISTNPITWTLENNASRKNMHQGILFPNKIKMKYTLVTYNHLGMLWVREPTNLFFKLFKRNNYHPADFNLFWLNIRQNLKSRLNKYYMINSPQ
jgi:hypothetical protein